MSNLIQNSYSIPKTRLNFSRSLFPYKRTHSCNMLTGKITPVGYFNLRPGDTPPNKFGFVLQSAPLLGYSLDNAYIDIISVWCPTRLVWEDHHQWLGDNDRYAWTLNTNVNIPKLTKMNTAKTSTGQVMSKSYVSEHFVAPHLGMRLWNSQEASTGTDFTAIHGTESRFYNGLSVIPFRTYSLIYNKLFRNENISNPLLFSKQSGTDLVADVALYSDCGGELESACRLKNFINMARISPAIDTVDVLQGLTAPVGLIPTSTLTPNVVRSVYSSAGTVGVFGELYGAQTSDAVGSVASVGAGSIVAQLSGLTVNSLYYSIMLQKYFNKASTGRRPVEFYKLFFGIDSSEVGHDDPQLLSQKRFKINISRIVATANSQDQQNNMQPLGSIGGYSLTADGGILWPDFTATEYGMIMVFAVIRTQESFASGIERYLSDSNLLSTYLPEFDHIGYDFTESREFADYPVTNNNYIFGYNPAWYQDRNWLSDVVGILSPGEPLGYFTFAREFIYGATPFVINDAFIKQTPFEFDRLLQFPVCYDDNTKPTVDLDGEPYASTRYQWLIQFAIVGDFARIMSKDSEQLVF